MPAKLAKRPPSASRKSAEDTGSTIARCPLARVVRPARAPSPVARRTEGARLGRPARPLSGLAVGSHAAADDGEGRRALFRSASLRAGRRRATRRRGRARRDGRLGGARLLLARPQPDRLRPRGRGSTRRAVSRTAPPSLRAFPASAPIPRRRSQRSPSTSRSPWSTAMSSASSRGSSRSMRQCPPRRRSIREKLQPLVPADRAGEFAEALMDLGATICTPRKPACALCPWSEPCVARQRRPPARASGEGGRSRRGRRATAPPSWCGAPTARSCSAAGRRAACLAA